MKVLQRKFKSLVHFLLAFFAYWFYGRPARKLIVVGVTGTKGKSTTCRFIASVLEAGGSKVGMLTTVEFQIGDKRWLNDKKMTMLGRGQIQRMLREMVHAGCQYVVVETSSEGILQYRHYGLEYDVAVFTNLGTEHSERHGGFANLRRDKGKMFAVLSSATRKIVNGQKVPKVIVVNADDKEAGFYLSYAADKKIAYAFEDRPTTATTDVQLVRGVKGDHNSFSVDENTYEMSVIGDFNRYNGLAAVAVGISQGIAPDRIADGVKSVKLVPGRMEFIEAGQSYKVVVDYAHEAMSLSALFTTLRSLVGDKKIISVVGSDGGGRDKAKRAGMGEISGRLTDIVIITDVNCYDENPEEIADMLGLGARGAGKIDNKNLFIIVDRRAAIKKAFELAGPGDVVAITAKGTEPFIGIANGQKIPWDDRQVARELIQEQYASTRKSTTQGE